MNIKVKPQNVKERLWKIYLNIYPHCFHNRILTEEVRCRPLNRVLVQFHVGGNDSSSFLPAVIISSVRQARPASTLPHLTQHLTGLSDHFTGPCGLNFMSWSYPSIYGTLGIL